MELLLRRNWVLLIEKTTNLNKILAELYSREIISADERDIIENEYVHKSSYEKNKALYTILEKKDIRNSQFQEILIKTENRHIIDELWPKNDFEKIENHLFWEVPERNKKVFVGRDNEFDKILKEISQNDLKVNTCKIVLNGIAGIGKTWIVKEFIYRNKSTFSHIIWFDGQAETNLSKQIINLIYKLNIYFKKIDLKKFLKILQQNWFENVKNINWLLVFDNFDEKSFELFDQFIPRFGGCIIMTTRILSNFSAFFEISVPNFNPNEGKILVKNILGHEQRNCIEKLCSELDFNPMCISNACQFILDRKIKIEKYIELLETCTKSVFNDSSQNINEKSVYLNFKISFENLKKENPVAFKWLQICSFNHPNETPKFLIEEYLHMVNEIGENPVNPKVNLWNKIKKKVQRKKIGPIELEVLEIQKIICKYGLFKIENDNDNLSIQNIVQKSITIFSEERTDGSSEYFYQILRCTWLNKIQVHLTWLNCPTNLKLKMGKFQIELQELDKIYTLKQTIFEKIKKIIPQSKQSQNFLFQTDNLTLVTNFSMFINDEKDDEFIGYFDIYDSKNLNLSFITHFYGQIGLLLRNYKEDKLILYDNFDYSDTIELVLEKFCRFGNISYKDHYFFKIQHCHKDYLENGHVRDLFNQINIIDYQKKSDREQKIQIFFKYKTQFCIEAFVSDRIAQILDQIKEVLFIDDDEAELSIIYGDRQLLEGDILFDECIESGPVFFNLVVRFKRRLCLNIEYLGFNGLGTLNSFGSSMYSLDERMGPNSMDPNRGSFKFPNISLNQRFITRNLNRNSEPFCYWRNPRTGLNIHGICSNLKCSAKNQKIISPMGTGVFNLKFDLNKIFCPRCKNRIKRITSCGFTNVFWRILGRSQFEPEKFIESCWTKTGPDEYTEFDEKSENANKYSIKWFHLRLVIQTIVINEYDEDLECHQNNICSLCLGQVFEEWYKNDCGHKCHPSCFNYFNEIKKSGMFKMDQLCRLCIF